MTTAEFLADLRRAGVELRLAADRLLYDAPAGAMTPELRSALASRKAELIAFLGRLEPAADGAPLSFAQESLWFLHQLYPGETRASEQFAIRFEGPLDGLALDRAWQALLERHAILRACFLERDGVARQFVGVPGNGTIPVTELGKNAEEELLAAARNELRIPFDLARGPLLRPRLFRAAADRHVLLVTAEHLVADGLSVAVIRADLAALYGGFVPGAQPARLPPVAQYADFARRQRSADGDFGDALAYWRHALAQLPAPVLESLPRPAGPLERPESRRVPFVVPPDLATRARRLGRECGATPFMVLLAAFRALLGRISGQDDIVIGTPMTVRDSAETRMMVGCFVNPVALRTPLAGEPSFRDLIGRERATVLGALQHREVPFSRVVAAVGPERRVGEHPLFQVLFSFEAGAGEVLPGGGAGFCIEAVPAARASFFDLECALRDDGDGQPMHGHVAFATARIEAWVGDALPGHFLVLLADAVGRPDAPVSRLELLAADERARLILAGSGTTAWPAEQTLHGLFLQQAARTPQATAVRSAGGNWTYRALKERSAALAAALAAGGVVPGAAIGLAVGNSPERVAALLAILRAGAIAVPLDPSYPRARLRFILRDAGVAHVVADAAGAACLPPGDGLHIVAADDYSVAPGRCAPARENAPDGALILYTSGSTGEPKGAVVGHRGAVSRCHWMWEQYGFCADDVFAQRTSANFIDSLWEIFGPLGRGASILVVPDDVAGDPLRLPAWLAGGGATHLVLVPSLLRALLDGEPDVGSKLGNLRSCISSGEPLDPGLVHRFRRALPACRLLNTYGTTEIWDATCYDTGLLPADAARVPIGRPVANARVYVLDRNLQPLPVGVPGELCVAGPGVGPGYWRRPALTAEKFVPDPFAGPDSPGLLYRTGDIARFLPAGNLECLGRLDSQLKVRGFRLEAREIEGAIAAHPAVAEAAVAIRPVANGAGEARLAGYVVNRPGASVEAADLRAFLQATLPGPLVPTAWMTLDRLPRTPSGKLDRRALPEPADAPVPPRDAPRSATERRLAALWEDVIGVRHVGLEQNFFDAGGHSLLATRLVTRIRAAFGVELGLRDVFDQPTVAALARAIDSRRPGAPAFVPVERTAELPLSFAEERLWFLDQLDPASPAYNVAWTLRIDGPCSPEVLRRSVEFLVARHEPLRTCFPAVDGRPRRVIGTGAAFDWRTLDLAGADDAAAEAALTKLAREPFDLARGPLLRAILARRASGQHVLLLVLHHIVTDATSNHVLFDELAACYAAFAGGTLPLLPVLTVQYADFAAWQRRQLSDPLAGRELEFWRARLAGAPPALELPADRPRPPEQSFRGAWVRAALPASLARGLVELARARGCTLYHVLLAAFDVLLARSAGVDDVVVGSPVEGRLELPVERLVGLFINTVVLRTDLAGDPPFTELLARVRAAAIEAQAHQQLPFERLVEALRPERSLARSPVFQVMFNLVRMPERRKAAGPCTFGLDRLMDFGVAAFDLTLTAGEHADGIDLIFEYATDLFDAATIRNVAVRYETLLRAVVADAAGPISLLPLLGPGERDRLLRDFNPPAGRQPAFAPVHGAVAEWAARAADARAVSAGDDTLTYGELDLRANRLARHLAGQGIARGARVGICLQRSPDYLVAVLAVLKAGAAYVPLDPDYPAPRLSAMAEDAGLQGLITAGSLAPFATRLAIPCLDLRRESGAIGAHPATLPPVDVTADDPAYVLFTSGSTGRAKGVVVTHGNLASQLAAWRTVYALEPGEAHLQMASAAFDVFTGDWVRALGSGGRLVHCPRETLLEPAELLSLIRREAIRVGEFVPAVIRPLLAHLARTGESLAGMRLVIVGSDRWFGAEYAALRARCAAGARVVNSYGVAEATVDSAWFEAADDPGAGPVPIGRPFPNARLYVLDGNRQLVPAGVAGELWIGGAGVAAGYHGRPRLTAERFQPDPFSNVPGARMYRTGDQARHLRDGNLELLGRVDFQIKLRGFRIEPGEIEAALCQHPDVGAALVVAREHPAGDEQLVAYVEGRGGTVPVAGELRRHLKALLPDYMVPAAFVVLDELPRSPNGKLDRAALPAPGSATAESTVTGPRTAVEEKLCRLFAAVLGVPAVDIRTDFFAAGGHSLLATRLVARIRDALEVELPLRAVFEAPTVAGLAGALARAAEAGEGIGRRAPGEPVPLSLPQQRLWFLDRLEPGNPAYHLHWALRLRGPLDVAALRVALELVVGRHESLRTRFVERDGEVWQVIDAACPPPLDLVDIRPDEAMTLQAALRARLAAPFDLAAGPLLRTAILRTAPGEQVLLVVVHHIAADGWSLAVLARELSAAYSAFTRGQEPALPVLPVQYGDYAAWQQRRLGGAAFELQLDYWRRQLTGVGAVLELPADYPRPPVFSGRGAWLTRTLPPELLGALRDLARAEGCTLFMVLLAGFAVLLGGRAGTDDVVVGTPVAGRRRTELEGLIGFFVNTLVLRTDLKANPSFRELLARVKPMTLDAYAHQDVPFEKLVEVLKPPRSRSHNPLVQVLFSLHNQPREPVALAGLTVLPQALEADAVKFDLALHLAEEEAGLVAAFAYSTDLFSGESIGVLADAWRDLLARIVADPGLSIAALRADSSALAAGPIRRLPRPAAGSRP